MTLRGWKQITEYTGLSEASIKELMERKKNPFPVIMIARKYMTTEKQFNAWIDREIESQKAANKRLVKPLS